MGVLENISGEMKFAAVVLILGVAAVQSASVDIDWKYGMTENEVCVAPGDIVNFIWTTNHNVAPVSAEDYLACITADTEPYEGPLAWTAPAEEQMVYVICGVRSHCADVNQTLAITVSNSCSTSQGD